MVLYLISVHIRHEMCGLCLIASVLRTRVRRAAPLYSFFGRMRGAKERHALPIIEADIGSLAADATNLRLARLTALSTAIVQLARVGVELVALPIGYR